MTLIDGVIQVGSDFGKQCLQWVNDVTHGAGAGYGSAGSLELAAQGKGILSQTPHIGDVAVWAANTGGAGSSGHAGLVTGLGGGGEVAVTGTNWPSGSGATQYIVGHNPVGMGTPSGYINPTSIGGKNIIAGGGTFDPFKLGNAQTYGPAVNGILPTGPGPGWSIGPWQVFSGAGLNRVLFVLAGVAMVGVGLLVVFRKDVPQIVSKVAAA